MKTCIRCGSQMEDKALFCPECGMQQAGGSHSYDRTAYGPQAYENQAYGQTGYTAQGSYSYPQSAMGRERNIALCIVFSFLTCGLYVIYWIVCLNDDINLMSNEQKPTSGIMVILFNVITCGIYGFYWYYKMGAGIDRIKGVNGYSGILFLVLGIFGLGIINLALMQDTINNMCRR